MAARPSRVRPGGRTPRRRRAQRPGRSPARPPRADCRSAHQLEQRAVASWDAVEGPERAAVIARSLSGDDGPEAQLRHRYDRDAQNALLRSITMLIRIRKRRDELAEHHRKQARDHQIERINVGGGWWREKDANASPPGYQPINRFAPSPNSSPAPDEASPDPDPLTISRNEPTAEPSSPIEISPNHNPENKLRPNSSEPSPRRPERSRPNVRPLTDRLRPPNRT
ncbi:hypothetical protein [Tautonia marina]|uniref:hypothetical protein n=1 Tax=Tautonia marina TaxID=2653855 RepID=UPI00191C33E3|nr:hypothetical protein [Tautonia marina]